MIDYDRLASAYARNRRVHPEVIRHLIRDGGVADTSSALEVGCGTGNYIAALADLTGCRCWGIDPSQEMLALAGQRTAGVIFGQGRAESLDFPGGFFDLIFSVDVIHHVGDRPASFREAHRVLKPGGRICTVTDSAWIIRHRQPLSTYFPETVDADLARYPRIETLRAALEHVGFAEVGDSTVEFAYGLTDAQPYRDKAFSVLHLIGEDAFQKGIRRLEQDLRSGPIPCVSRYLLLWGVKR